MAKRKSLPGTLQTVSDYSGLLGDVVSLLESARGTSVRAVNAVMTATYWQIGRRIVDVEQQGFAQAGYGDELVKRLATDLTVRFGRGFGWRNLYQMRAFHLAYQQILQTPSAKLRRLSKLDNERFGAISEFFPLPWSHYVKLLSVQENHEQHP